MSTISRLMTWMAKRKTGTVNIYRCSECDFVESDLGKVLKHCGKSGHYGKWFRE